MESTVEKPAKRGRPLSFDRDAALENAMHVFWEHGYEAASIADLTAAMGITPPSLYTAFGDKEHLFMEAIERYANGPAAGMPRALAEAPTAREAIENFLRSAARELTCKDHPRGCMVMVAATTCSVGAKHIAAAMAKRRAANEQGIRDRIAQGVENGELPEGTDPTVLAGLYTAVFGGMSMQARDGASRATLMATVDAAMQAWPTKKASARPKKT